MDEQTYDMINKLADLCTAQGNLLAEVVEKLNELALIYENAARELNNEQ